MFGFLTSLKNTGKNIINLFTHQTSDNSFDTTKLEQLLLAADVGPQATKKLCAELQKKLKVITDEKEQIALIKKVFLELLSQKQFILTKPVILCVGINGSGKTSTLIKLACLLRSTGKNVLLCAADTFRAAGAQQLVEQADKLGIAVVSGAPNQDPASVVYRACEEFHAKQNQPPYDYLLIDTAGRLQSNTNLMLELAKIKRIIAKKLDADSITTLLMLDSMLGQNSFNQAKIFHEQLTVDGIILTKLDGSAKGGIIFAVAQELQVPVAYITYGEATGDIAPFDAPTFVDSFLS